MHEWLFANQATWSEAADAADQFRKQAVALGADGAKYDACLTDPATEARIQRDVQDGMSVGRAGHARLPHQRLVPERRVSVRGVPEAHREGQAGPASGAHAHPAAARHRLLRGGPEPCRADLRWQPDPGQGRCGAGVALLRGLQERGRCGARQFHRAGSEDQVRRHRPDASGRQAPRRHRAQGCRGCGLRCQARQVLGVPRPAVSEAGGVDRR